MISSASSRCLVVYPSNAQQSAAGLIYRHICSSSNTHLFLFFKMWQQTSTADMLDLAVDHIRGLQGELQVCTAHVRDPLVHTVRKRTCQSSCYFNSQIATAKQTRSGVEYLDFSIAVGSSSPIITISLCQSILFNQYHHELYRIDQYANRATLIFSPYIYICTQALREDKEKCTCRGDHPPGR